MKAELSTVIDLINKKVFKTKSYQFKIDDDNVILFSGYHSLRLQAFSQYVRIFDLNTMQKGFIQYSYSKDFSQTEDKILNLLAKQDIYFKDRKDEDQQDFKRFKDKTLKKYYGKYPKLKEAKVLQSTQMATVFSIGKLDICFFFMSRNNDHFEQEIMINQNSNIDQNEEEEYKIVFEKFVRLITDIEE